MNKEELKSKVKDILEGMGYKNIEFLNGQEDLLVASFDADELISFKADLPGWNYSGIQLDTLKVGRYKIEFRKITEVAV